MAVFTAFIHELFKHLDGSKMYMDGVDSDYGIKDNNGKDINTRIKGIVNFMNNSPDNSSRQNSSIGNNNLGRHIDNNGVQGSSSGEIPVSNSFSGVRPVNPMSITQMCGTTQEL